jgi:virginiamycin A acetyltransferase
MLKRIIKKIIISTSKEGNLIQNELALPANSYISGSEISGRVQLSEGCKIYRANLDGNVQIGRYTSFWGPNIYVGSILNTIKIGSFCSIARNVSIQETYHRSDCLSTYHILKNIFNEDTYEELASKGDITIGNDVWLGANTIILSGVTIGHGSIVAAGAVVNKEVPPFAIVAGNPARVVKYRFTDEIIARLLEVKWWDWEIDKIKVSKHIFRGALTMERLESL